MFPHVLADLRRDAAALPHRGPATINDEQIPRHRVIVATRPDGKGFGARVGEVLRGMTRREAEARDIVDRIHASTNKNDATSGEEAYLVIPAESGTWSSKRSKSCFRYHLRVRAFQELGVACEGRS